LKDKEKYVGLFLTIKKNVKNYQMIFSLGNLLLMRGNIMTLSSGLSTGYSQMRSEKELQKKLVGWHGAYRGKFLLIKNRILTKEEYILYDASIAFADWDKNHTNTYGSLDLKQDEFEVLLGVSDGFVSRYGKNLFTKGFWRKRKDNLIQVIGFELIEINLLNKITKKDLIVDMQKYIADLQTNVADPQQENANFQQNFSKEENINQPQKVADLQQVVSKSNLVSYKDKVIILRSDEEYKKIIEEFSFSQLSVEDMKWIDINVCEDPNVPS